MRPRLEAVRAIHSAAAVRWQKTWALRTETRIALNRCRIDRRERARLLRHALRARRAAVLSSPLPVAPAAAESAGLWEISPNEGASIGSEALRGLVLRAIVERPDGIHTLEIGNRLGVDWRRVVDAVRTLVDGDMVEQIGTELYPAGKVGPR